MLQINDAELMRLKSEIASVARRQVAQIEAHALAIVPVDTGALRASIRIEDALTRDYYEAHVIAGNGQVDYAIDVETRTPFLRPALSEFGR